MNFLAALCKPFTTSRKAGASIVSIIEPDSQKRLNPEADTVLNEGATLILAGDRSTIDAVKRLLVQGRVK